MATWSSCPWFWMPGKTTRQRGSEAEAVAAKYLQRAKCRIIEKNYLCKAGEIDLIVMDGNTLVFVEVRYRANTARGSGAQSVTRTKIQRIVRTASHYLMTHSTFRGHACRFDVISIDDKVTWYRAAFTADT